MYIVHLNSEYKMNRKYKKKLLNYIKGLYSMLSINSLTIERVKFDSKWFFYKN